MVVARYNVKHGKTPADDALLVLPVGPTLATTAITNMAVPP